jgi:hypothetical protein
MNRAIICTGLLFAWIGPIANAEVSFDVSLNDPFGLMTPFRSQIESHALAAAEFWGARFSSNASIQISIRPANEVARAFGQSTFFPAIAHRNGFSIHEQGAGFELRTGTDPNGTAPDIELGFNLNYLTNELWFDPDPVTRQAIVPSNRTDAMSVFLHEIGHGFAMNGWRADADFSLPSSFMSTFDELLSFENDNVFFTGSEAMSLFGAPVPMTRFNHRHFGNIFPRPGSELIPDLMNGVVFFRGTRYSISDLDLALMSDVGLPVRAIPVPGMLAIFLCASAAPCIRRRRHNRFEDGTIQCC